MKEFPLNELKCAFVQFTDTRGVLKVMRPHEDARHAHGFIFKCPRCAGDKQREHYNILLFDVDGVPKDARPLGRFKVCNLSLDELGRLKPGWMGKITLFCVGDSEAMIEPGDIACKWRGHIIDGKAYWMPNVMERLFK